MFVVPREPRFLAGFKEFNQALVGVIPDFGCCSLLTDLASKLLPLGLETITGGHYKSSFMIMWGGVIIIARHAVQLLALEIFAGLLCAYEYHLLTAVARTQAHRVE